MVPAQAVLFISFGGPERPEDVMPFLEHVTRGRGIPRERLLEVAHHYELMGGASPINDITRRQAESLGVLLRNRGRAMPVYIGQRHAAPFLEDTLRQMAQDGIRRAVGFITAPHRCEASLERYAAAVDTARRQIGDAAPVIDYVGPWFDHPKFIEAIGERLDAVAPECRNRGPIIHPDHVGPRFREDDGRSYIFTAHSIPCSMAKGSTYVQELRETARLVAERLGIDPWSLAYTSRSGNPRDPWLEPDISETLRAKAHTGIKDALLIPIGFVADHVEVLFDLDIEARQTARELGLGYRRAETVNDHPLFIEMIAEVVLARADSAGEPWFTDSKISRTSDGRSIAAVGPSVLGGPL